MMRRIASLALVALLAACVSAPGPASFAQGQRDIAEQRMRFAFEAVCLNNETRAAQDRAAQRVGFPIRDVRDGEIIFVNPGTLTFLRLGPYPEQQFSTPAGAPGRVPPGHACSVGSPAVSLDTANRIVGQVLSPRLVDGSETLSQPLGAGRNDAGGIGLFFESVSVTMPFATTVIPDEQTGQPVTYDHPIILIRHL